jgi:hypothetical protein
MWASVWRVEVWRSRLSRYRTRRKGQRSAAESDRASIAPMIFWSSPQYRIAFSEMSPLVRSRDSNSAASRAARAQSRRAVKCSSSVFVPRCVTKRRRSFEGSNGFPALKSCQKSPMALLHSSSLELTLKLRLTCPASLAVVAPAHSIKKSSVCQPRRAA